MLRIFRAQTAPATLLLVLTPFLCGVKQTPLMAMLIGIYAILVHYFSFGCNSLLDTAMGYDIRDRSKSHHPLVSGRISLWAAHNLIHFGILILAFVGVWITITCATNPTYALACFSIFIAAGYAYNAGLSKESLFGFIPISICFTALGGWAWFLTHNTLGTVGKLLLAYIFTVILFQISYSGHLKEIEVGERSNLLIKLGAKVEDGVFMPGLAWLYGATVKLAGVVLLVLLAWIRGVILNIDVTLWMVVMIALIIRYLSLLTSKRRYDRNKDLLNMSIMEVLSIYIVMPIALSWDVAGILMIFGLAYFFSFNKMLWKTPYPKV